VPTRALATQPTNDTQRTVDENNTNPTGNVNAGVLQTRRILYMTQRAQAMKRAQKTRGNDTKDIGMLDKEAAEHRNNRASRG
jgi:hypothetical protein